MAEKDNILHQQIDDFFAGRLSGEELASFEKNLKEDTDFASKVKMHKLIIRGIREFEEDNVLKLIMQTADAELENISPPQISDRKLYLYSAAAIAIILTGIYFLFIFESQSQKLFKKYFTLYPNQISLSRSIEIPEEFSHFSEKEYEMILNAMRYYDKGDYNKTCNILENLTLSTSKDPKVLFYLAISQMEEGKINMAIQNLKYLSEQPKHDFQPDAKWYLALAYLHEGQNNDASIILKQLSTARNEYTNKAEELLLKLK